MGVWSAMAHYFWSAFLSHIGQAKVTMFAGADQTGIGQCNRAAIWKAKRCVSASATLLLSATVTTDAVLRSNQFLARSFTPLGDWCRWQT